MANQTSNDNDGVPPTAALQGPDAHGQAALLLVESLIHGLIAKYVINAAEAVEIVGVASEVKEEVAAELGDSPATMRKSLTLLAAIGASIANDIDDAEPPIRPVS